MYLRNGFEKIQIARQNYSPNYLGKTHPYGSQKIVNDIRQLDNIWRQTHVVTKKIQSVCFVARYFILNGNFAFLSIDVR